MKALFIFFSSSRVHEVDKVIVSNIHPCTDFAQPVGRAWAINNNPKHVLTHCLRRESGCLRTVHCVLWSCGYVLYLWNTVRFLGWDSGLRVAHQEQVLWSPGPFWNTSSSQEATTAPQLCVRQAQQRSACAREWSSQQENLQRSVLNCSVLLPHHIYKILNRHAPAVAFHSFLLLISSSDW